MKSLISWVLLFFLISQISFAQEGGFLFRSVTDAKVSASDFTTETAQYRPLFGSGDKDSLDVKGVERFGHLSINAGGKSRIVSYKREEQVYYILEGTGILHYGKLEIPVSRNDYVYLPAGVKHGLSNPREKELKVLVMGYEIPADSTLIQVKKLNLASADDVPLQVVGKHPADTKFKLLMGTYLSERDRLAVACQINSLFIMDFEPGATNNPHQHPVEEEIYYVLRGNGDMVAGGTREAENRVPAKEGDVFFFSRNTLVGFYNNTQEGLEHAIILAVRSKFPGKSQ